MSEGPQPEPTASRRRPLLARPAAIVGAAFVASAAIVIAALLAGSARNAPVAAAGGGGAKADAVLTNPNLDPGSALSGAAPAFSLTDQFGRRVTLRSLRGRVVLLAFIDPRCTATCPLTTATMTAAIEKLGRLGRRTALIGIDANPRATAVRAVRAYSRAHGVLHRWRFLTAPPSTLRGIWRAYHVSVSVNGGQVEQTPALFLIDARGDWRRLFVTQQSYSTIGEQARIVASEVAALLSGASPQAPRGAFAQIAPIEPGSPVSLPRAGGGFVTLGEGSPRLVAFDASWRTQTANARAELTALAGYQRLAQTRRLPPAVLVDEASVEPPGGTAAMRRLAARLPLPVVVDSDGRLADGYEVQDLPWLVLTSRTGAILWYWDASTQGWPSAATLARHVQAALGSPAKVAAPSAATARHLLAGSPAALSAVHSQAGALLGDQRSLQARLRALRGYPIVLNAWASWCDACREEYSLFASASVRYGREVAFLGVDTNDTSAANASSFLATHPVSYPSYRSTMAALAPIAALIGLPTTIFIDRAGRVTCVRPGQYDSVGALDADIVGCALRGRA